MGVLSRQHLGRKIITNVATAMHHSNIGGAFFEYGEARSARRLSSAVISRGGPAMLVFRPDPSTPAEMENFYRRLIHNFPLDEAVRPETLQGRQGFALFAGGGREEGLRFTRLGEEL